MQTPTAVGRVFNIGSDQPVTILELAKQVIAEAQSESTIEFQSYARAYDDDFEDIRHRVPDLTRIQGTIDYQRRFELQDIIRHVVAWKRELTVPTK
jgi:UDP-glucose 4-epimerase